MGLKSGVNLYSYVAGRPTMRMDPWGLVEWNCRVAVLLKAGELFGGGIVTASCKSPCVNGEHRFVQMAGLAGGISAGSPIEMSGTDLRLEDGASEPLASNLSPYFSIKSLGISIIYGYSVETDVTLGRATGKTSGWDWGGLSGGFDALWGATTIIIDMKTCCK